MDPLREYEEKIRRYEERDGPLRGHRGARSHLDPAGTPGRSRREPEALARELLQLIFQLDQQPGNRVLILRRAAVIERELDAR